MDHEADVQPSASKLLVTRLLKLLSDAEGKTTEERLANLEKAVIEILPWLDQGYDN